MMPKHMYKFCLLSLAFVLSNKAEAQGPDLGNFFRPRVEVYMDASDGLSSPGSPRFKTNQRLGQGLFYPIKTRLGANFDLIKALEGGWKTALTPKIYQVFGSLRAEFADHRFESDSNHSWPAKFTSQRVSAGITGLHLRRNLSLIFYTVSIGQNNQSFKPGFDPQVIAVLGKVRPKSLKYAWVYGAAVAKQSHGGFAAVPFGGISYKIHRYFSVNAILPVQVKFRYRFNAKAYMDAGSWVNGERIIMDAMNASGKYNVFRYASLRNGLQFQYKFARSFRSFISAGVEAPVNVKIVNLEGSYSQPRWFVRAAVQFNIGTGMIDSGKFDFIGL